MTANPQSSAKMVLLGDIVEIEFVGNVDIMPPEQFAAERTVRRLVTYRGGWAGRFMEKERA
jgi:hypothetical protein